MSYFLSIFSKTPVKCSYVVSVINSVTEVSESVIIMFD